MRKSAASGASLQDVLAGLHQSIERAQESLHLASRLADEFAPPHRDDDEDRQLWERLCLDTRPRRKLE
ncbi:hypothetical protein [Enhygromyxa salina]|uniref:hypothetical protein n=1 Tax=Enhygromyxa salina TaxID=215803 RepID=UPI0011BAAEDD|nr:hypothetical protein [Enhygromyxa salina]